MTCHQDSACIVWADNPVTGSPQASPFLSALAENDAQCTPTGFYVPASYQVTNTATFAPVARDGQPAGLSQVPVESGSLVLDNPSDRVMNVIVQVSFGAVRMRCTSQCAPAVIDFVKWGVAGLVAPIRPSDTKGWYQFEDHNLTHPDDTSVIGIPGRSVPFVMCPSLPAGASAEVRYQRSIDVSGQGLADFLLQPTVISMWGIIV